MMELLPWHLDQWRKLLRRLRADNLPHALLLCGPAGLGKVQFSAFLVQTLLCETGISKGNPCGQCRSCQLFAAHNHPDLRLVSPMEEGKVIGVDQVREISQYLSHTSQYGGHQAVIITPAEQMNLNAANSLLKTLEEPTPQSLLILVSDRPGRLPATILSRCQRIDFAVPNDSEAVTWLAERIDAGQDAVLLLSLAEGAPLRALELAASSALLERSHVIRDLEDLAKGEGDLSAIAERFVKIGARPVLNWLYNWVVDMVRHLSGDDQDMTNRDVQESLVRLARGIELRSLHAYLQRLCDALRMTGGNLNPQLSMESVLMAWQETFLPKRGSVKQGARHV